MDTLLDCFRLGHRVDPDGLLLVGAVQPGIPVIVEGLDFEAEDRPPESAQCMGVDGVDAEILERDESHASR